MKKTLKKTLKLLAATCVAALSVNLAIAEETVELRYGTHIGSTSPGVVHGAQVLIDRAHELSGGTLKINLFPGEQAGKALQMFDLVKAGAVDIGNTATGYVSSDKLPLIGIMELPGLATSACSVTSALFKLGAPGGALYEHDLKPHGMRILAYMPYPPYGPAVSRTKIDSVEDLKGMKMRIAGGLMEHTAASLGGVPVKVPAPEVYQALERGTLDTVLFSFLSVKSFDLNNVVDFGATGYSFGTPGDIVFMTEKRLKSMSQKQQDALFQAGKEASMHWCGYVDGVESTNIKDMGEAGLKIHKWTDDQVKQLNEATASVSKDWAMSLDKRGKPASEVLKTFISELKK